MNDGSQPHPPAIAQTAGRADIIVQIVGDGNSVVSGHPALKLTRFDTLATVLTDDTGRPVETDLLRAYKKDTIPLIGRDETLATLRAWLASDEPISALGMVGRAGRGKTRLALELCRELAGQGWRAGFLTTDRLEAFRKQQNVTEWGWNAPTLVVVDYAAGQVAPLRRWLVELADHRRRLAPVSPEAPPLRIVLLERQYNPQVGWWADLFAGGDTEGEALRSLRHREVPLDLPAITDPAVQRDILVETGKRLGNAEAESWGDRLTDEQVSGLTWGGEPLFLMMAAMLVAENGPVYLTGLTRHDLAGNVAKRELTRIERLARARLGDGDAPAFLTHMAGASTLLGGLDLGNDLRDLIAAESQETGRTEAGSPAGIEGALRDALPGEPGRIAPIEPDAVGEAALLTLFGDLAGEERDDDLMRLARRAPPAAASVLMRLCQDYAPTGREEPLRWVQALGPAFDEDLGARLAIADSIPRHTTILREFAAAFQDAVTARLSAMVDRNHDLDLRGLYAGNLNNLANRLSDLGRREEALSAAEEAVGLYRALAAARPEAFTPDLAMSLNNLANRLSDLGRREEALSAAKEAVRLYRALAAARPEAFTPDLAGSFNSLANVLSDLGRREEALSAAEEAVGLYRALAAARPEAFTPDLAMSLNNLANVLSDLGRREAALSAAEEAVGLYRALAAARPEAFTPALAMSLNNLANVLSNLGRREEALSAAEEAVGLRRSLAAARPEAFTPDLATSLNNLAGFLSNLGRREEALSAAEEAVGLRRSLAAARPEAFTPDLAGSFNNLAGFLSDLGRREEALSAAEEAVGLYRALAAARPEAFTPDLAMSLNNLASFLSDLGRREEALSAAEEAVGLRRSLAAARPEAFTPDLAGSFNNLASFLSDLGRREEALSAAEEAVGLRRSLAAARPEAFTPDLAMSLNNLANRLSNLGRREEALSAAEEAVGLRRSLAAARPEAFTPDLATSLNNLASVLSNLGRREEALSAAEEAVGLRRSLAAARPEAFTPDLATSLAVLGLQHRAAGRPDTEIACFREAAERLWPYVEQYPEGLGNLFTAILQNLVRALQATGTSEVEIRNALTEFGVHIAEDDPDA